METARYAAASLALGAIAVWGSEVLFWSAAPAGLTAAELLFTWMTYSVVCASVLSAAAWSGARGASGIFLCGALMGWLIEGVIVGEMYLFFPFQVVWTPLAWHALLTAVGVFGLLLVSAKWTLARQLAAMVGLGVVAGVWATYWPLERDELPGFGATLAYIGGTALAVPLACVTIDRIGRIPRPPRLVMWVAPGLLLLIWCIGTAKDPSATRLTLPALLLMTLWTMRRLGKRSSADTFSWQPARPVRHLTVLIAPPITAAIAAWAWQGPGFEVNVPFAVAGSLLGSGWWLWLVLCAIRGGSLSRAKPSANA